MTEEEADGLLMQNARVKIGTAEKASTPTLNL
jgi:hypothetical protein